MAVFHLTLFIVTIVILFIYLATRSRHTDSLTFVQEQQAIANFGVLGKPNLQSRLRARAIPNQRLIKAFGIVSSFTTEDPRIHNEFLRRASVDINKMGQSDCVEFFSSAKLSLSQTITHLDPTAQRALPLARVVRAFVLIAILNKFFRIEPSSVDVKAAIRAAEAINRLWVQSKNPDQEGQDVDQSILQSALELLLPKHFPCHPKDNPLNIIMPAYETMWRVVLLTYVAAGFQSQDETASRQFRGVVDMIPKCFSPEDKLSQEMALNFAKEGLRLYPPTRRVYRAVMTARGDTEIKHADVEKCHRDKNIWGSDALQFRPSRWRTVSADMQRAYMPFSNGRHTCPAAWGFGYRAIIILVAALARRLGTRDAGAVMYFGGLNGEIERHPDTPLPYGRQELEGWLLLPKK
ncbi:cytochrome P450 [Hypoxylon rubiginosum]|uniref:Cytochrome P450 n=1 Tax=Hypoxylon rubiginosum TaxID=110542 RepID=A0ACC0CR23_9PEZI|nr:cytochrome P450 [Hypoxylon rubiginosum]